jgi:hypothetical protein
LPNVFPRLRDLTESFEAVQDQAPPAILAILRKRLAEIDAARDFIAKAEWFSVWADPSLAPDRWQWLADVLPIDFENAMRSADPNYKTGLSHNGPLARFIAAVVPSLTGQHPNPDSVVSISSLVGNTDDLKSYAAAASELSLARRHEPGRWRNNRAENSHQPTDGHLQHFQRPTPSHFCKDTPSLSCGGYEHVARGSRGCLKIFETQNSRVLLSTT